jgi:V8-like Glu-specific endopeptidase
LSHGGLAANSRTAVRMPHFLDTIPFDWSRPEARDMRDYLATTYFRAEPVIRFAVEAGVRPAAIAWSQPMQSVWHDLITQARNENRLRDLLTRVAAGDEAVGLRLAELMAAEPVVPAPVRRGAGVSWRGFDDRGDLERQLFDDPTLLDIAFLRRGLDLAPAVARLLVTLPDGRFYGTAFRIGADLLLTNHHVLHTTDEVSASSVDAWFDYELDTAGQLRAHRVVRCRPETIVADATHDWAVIRTADPLPDGVPVIGLTGADPVAVNDRVYIIQHPNGGVKKIGLHHNVVRHVDEDVVQYWTDTEPGSSGSPVFDEDWRLVALHHRWVSTTTAAGEREHRNQGRRISRVTAGLAAAGIGVG